MKICAIFENFKTLVFEGETWLPGIKLKFWPLFFGNLDLKTGQFLSFHCIFVYLTNSFLKTGDLFGNREILPEKSSVILLKLLDVFHSLEAVTFFLHCSSSVVDIIPQLVDDVDIFLNDLCHEELLNIVFRKELVEMLLFESLVVFLCFSSSGKTTSSDGTPSK